MPIYPPTLIPESAHAGDIYLDEWGDVDEDGHAVTIVGYCDDVLVVIDNDGSFTNDEDNNGDGVIDIRDWERGALKVANSWSINWGNGGFIWIPCSVLGNTPLDPITEEPMPLYAFCVTAIEEYQPEYTAKIKLSHEERDKFIALTVAASSEINAEPPQTYDEGHYFEML